LTNFSKIFCYFSVNYDQIVLKNCAITETETLIGAFDLSMVLTTYKN